MPPLVIPRGLFEFDPLTAAAGEDWVWIFDTSAGVWKRVLVGAISNAARRTLDVTISADSNNNWAPTDIDIADWVRISGGSNGSRRITGISAGGEGRTLVLTVVDSAVVFLLAEHTGSSAANRFGFGVSSAVVMLRYGDSAFLGYNTMASRWQLLGVSSLGGSARPVHHENFLDLTTSLQSSVAGVAAAATVAASAFSLREIALATGTDTTGRAGYGTKDLALLGQSGSRPLLFRSTFKAPAALSDATNAYTCRFGLLDSLSGEPTDGIYLRYIHSANSGKLLAVARSNGVESTQDTGIALVASETYHLSILVRPSAGTADFFLSADQSAPAFVGTISSNVPVAVARAYGAGASIIKSAGTTSRTLICFPFSVETVIA